MIILEPYLFRGFYQYDPDLGFRVRPYTFGTNEFGFNDRDYPLEKDLDTFRILIVSDSFNWAGGLEGNYTALLEKKFEAFYDSHRVDVINAGYPATHTGEQLAMLKKYGLQYDPDLVFLGFFAGNDFLDAHPNSKRIILNDVHFYIDKRKEIIFLGYPIIPQSRLFHFTKQKYQVYKELLAARRETKKTSRLGRKKTSPSLRKKINQALSVNTFLRIESGRLEFCNTQKHKMHAFDDQINYAIKSIFDMKELVNERNARFVVGIYPDEFQVNENLRDFLFQKFLLERKFYDIDLPQKILKMHLNPKQIPCLDFLDAFRDKNSEQDLYLPRNTHWNESGNELAASILFAYMLNIVKSEINH